jgi:spore germination protein GerM
MSNVIKDPQVAKRLARAIVSDIALYNKEKVEKSIKEDNIFDALKSELDEGEELYISRVDSELVKETNFYNIAIVDVMIKGCGSIESEIW